MKKFLTIIVLCLSFGIIAQKTIFLHCAVDETSETIEVTEEDKSSLALWIEEKFDTILTGLVSLVGTGSLLGLGISFIKKNSDKLIDVGVKYGKSHEEMTGIVEKINSVNDQLSTLTVSTTEKITNCISKVEEIENDLIEKTKHNDESISSIIKVLKLIACNNRELVENGSASKIAELLEQELKKEVSQDEVGNKN